MIHRRFGWREDAHDPLALPIRDRLAGRSLRPASVKHLRGKRLYQGPAGACVAFTLIRNLYVSLRGQGVQRPLFGSPKNAYAVGRYQEYAGVDADKVPSLVDKGMFPSKALLGVQRTGYCPWDADPYGTTFDKHSPEGAQHVYDLHPVTHERMINAKPPLSAHREAIDQTGMQWFSIPAAERSAIIAECLNTEPRLPVGLAMTVGKRFLDVNTSDPIGFEHLEEPEGGHMVSALEVLANGNVLIDNWWEDWGFEDGFGILSRALVESEKVRNVWALLPVADFA